MLIRRRSLFSTLQKIGSMSLLGTQTKTSSATSTSTATVSYTSTASQVVLVECLSRNGYDSAGAVVQGAGATSDSNASCTKNGTGQSALWLLDRTSESYGTIVSSVYLVSCSSGDVIVGTATASSTPQTDSVRYNIAMVNIYTFPVAATWTVNNYYYRYRNNTDGNNTTTDSQTYTTANGYKYFFIHNMVEYDNTAPSSAVTCNNVAQTKKISSSASNTAKIYTEIFVGTLRGTLTNSLTSNSTSNSSYVKPRKEMHLCIGK